MTSKFEAPDFPHGERRGYARGCRCDDCRAGNAREALALRRDRARRETPDGIPHGYSRYINWGCRCDVCVAANRDYMTEARRRRIGSPDTPHGTTSGYRFWGCRCELCREAIRAARTAKTGRDQAHTKARAHRSGAQWTGPELELASRRELPTRVVAEMIGRTYFAVETMRSQLDNPMLDFVAGVSRQVTA